MGDGNGTSGRNHQANSRPLPPQALEIAPSTGLQNILVHEYTKIDDSIVYNSITNVLAYYCQYLKKIATYLECEM